MEYYHSGKKSYQNYKFSCKQTNLTFNIIQDKIKGNTQFCREESSIKLHELASYITDGITFFIQEEEEIKGLINFTVNVDKITIKGLCVPEEYRGNGKILIEAVKTFAMENSITQIKLTCYGDVFNFYLKQGFSTEEEKEVYDSDDEDGVTSYDMIYNISSRGKRRRTKRKSKRRKSKKSPK